MKLAQWGSAHHGSAAKLLSSHSGLAESTGGKANPKALCGEVLTPYFVKPKTNMMIHPRIDLSFKDLISVKDAVNAAPREGQRRLSKNSEMKFVSRSVCLSNNRISDLTGLQCILSHFLAEPWMLGWLDLSFNQLPCIDPVLCELQELRVLYLHGNNIQKLSEVDKLAELPFLHTVTLHGNSIVSCTDYRSHVIYTLPRLKHMDFSAVTPAELSLANLWHRSTKHGAQNKSTE